MLSRSPIQLLPAELQNQIAAGEVVERPASVLKELVENSLDAQANRIRIQIRDGGQSLIKVSDNGYGIAADQLTLALTRHATSKISSVHDLITIDSFGFRGEALPSIASISRFRLASAQKDGEGIATEAVFGSISPPVPIAMTRGTDIEVRDLFANVPARLKFLKQPATESRKCSEIIMRVALAHPDLDIEVLLGERSAFHFLSGQSVAQRLQLVWPQQLLQDVVTVDFSPGPFRVTGLIGHPNTAQARADRIYLYVNKRPVQDKTMLSAVREAYRGRILGREYPQAVIFLNLPPEEIDVNVHPAKIEVRFQDESQIFQTVRRAVSMALDSEMGKVFPTAIARPTAVIPHAELPIATDMQPLPTAVSERVELMPSSSFLAEFLCGENPGEYSVSPMDTHAVREQQSQLSAALQTQGVQAYEPPAPLVTPRDVGQPSLHSTGTPTCTYLGQVLDTYLILSEPHGLTLLDQHAAHERVLYALLEQPSTPRERQPLLVPIEISLHSSQAEELQELWPTLQTLGFSLRLDGPHRLLVHAVPPLLSGGKAKEFLEDLLNAKDRSLHELWAMLACKAAVKAGSTLATQEALALIDAWRTLPDRQFCPHGRPVAITWTAKDLEKLFKRRP